MKVYALAARSFWLSTWLAAGVRPATSPPITMDRFRPSDMDGADVMYVCAHGLEGQPYWYGDRFITLASAAQVRLAKLDGSICFLAGCYGVGPMSDALFHAGAAAVIADKDVNWSGHRFFRLVGSNALGRLVVQGLRRGESAGEALDRGRAAFAARYKSERDRALLDTVVLLGDSGARVRRSAS